MSSKRVIVLQRGWVVVGDVEQYGPEIKVSNGSVVRRRGTTKGLGELAEKGPLESTVLDPCPPMRCHELTIVLQIDCNEEAWAAHASSAPQKARSRRG